MSETLDQTESMSTPRSVVAFMGGTFDPLHFGHLRMARELKQAIAAGQFRLVPCGDPYHKAHPVSPASQRVKMLELALANDAELDLDTRELKRDGPTYSYDTLVSLRQELGADASLIMVMGMDSFLSLPKWHNWQKLTELGHILVVHRPGSEQALSEPLQSWYANCKATQLEQLRSSSHGLVFDLRMTMLDISATQIRGLLSEGQSPQYLLPESVLEYINQTGLYCSQPD
ncbi:MAG: nicotinate-nucleotide adenylyltransferase [Pseudomonadales bacterium]|nr:nicotinate-nucleotide adenylyltransferase [Pseudomonadales bacterium]